MNQLGTSRPTPGVTATVRSEVARRPIVAFVGLAYLLSWAWWLPQVFAGMQMRVGVGWPTQLPRLLDPVLSALVVTALLDGWAGLRALWERCVRWRVGRWWLSVVAVPAAGAIARLATDGARNGAELTGYAGLAGAWGTLATVAVVFLVYGVGEELGWRGLAVERLSERDARAGRP